MNEVTPAVGHRTGHNPATPRVARAVRADWAGLATASHSEPVPFSPAMVRELPDPARRWLTHSIAPGTPLWSSAELTMRGEIRIGRWRPFTARQILVPSAGYIWAARSSLWGLPVTGYDRLSAGTGEMRWRLAGIVPVVSASGRDVTRSAAGRLAGEGALLPTTFGQATWTEGNDTGIALATWAIDSGTECAELHVAADGQLREITVNRWGNPDGAPFGRYPFGVSVEAEATFAGVTIPADLRAGWWWGTSRQDAGEFFRARITSAIFR